MRRDIKRGLHDAGQLSEEQLNELVASMVEMARRSAKRRPEVGAVRYGNSNLSYTLIRSARRKKTIEMTIDQTDGITVAAPATAPAATIAEIVLRRAGWILTRLECEVGTREKLFVSGETLPYLGREVRMEVTHREIDSVRLNFSHWSFELEVPSSLEGEGWQAAIRAAFVRGCRRRASDVVRRSVERWSRLMTLTPAGVAIRDQRRRWGSCAADGTLRFNWRIIMAEPALLEYVVVHEIVHLVHRNQGVVQIFCKGE